MTELIDAEVADTQAEAEPPMFPMVRKCPFALPEEYERLRAEEPVSRATFRVTGRPVWLISRQEHVRQVLSDATLSSNWKNRGFPMPVAVPDEILQNMDLPLIALDPPEHTVKRRLLIPEFTAKRMRALTPQIERVVTEHVDAILEQGPPADLVGQLAVPVPAMVFCELLGIPQQDAHVLLRNAGLNAQRNVDATASYMSHLELMTLFDKLVNEKAENPADDLISNLVRRNNAENVVSHQDLLGLIEVLLIGGLDTMSSAISLSIALLLEHPDQLAELKADPSRTKNAVHELLRYLSISDAVAGRVLPHDLEVGGVRMSAGDGVIALTGSANHDPAAWDDPDSFQIDRDAKGHSAFGHGIHQCLGAGLAQVQLETVINTVFARIPELRLAVPVQELPFKHETLSYGLYELPVAW